VGLVNIRKEPGWRKPSIVQDADPPLHARTRGVLTKVLSPGAVRKLRADFESEARRFVARVVDMGTADAVTDLAQPYPLKVFGDALGIPAEGRENLILFGSVAFNVFGPRNALHTNALEQLPVLSEFTAQSARREALSPGGFGQQIYAAADAGDISDEEAWLLVRSFLTAGVDTTVNGFGNMLLTFATHPDQWEALRANPALARSAFDEVIRFESPIQTFFRTTTKAVTVEGIDLGPEEKVFLSFAAANRDPRRWEHPDRFDIERDTRGHLAFGTGIHGCVGQMLARLEAEALLSALLAGVRRMELAGEPKVTLSNTARGFDHIPMAFSAN
jgi:cytochrome P450